MSYINQYQCPGSGPIFNQFIRQQDAVDEWGAHRRFLLSMAEKELIPCSKCGSGGTVNHRQCDKCEGKGYENV